MSFSFKITNFLSWETLEFEAKSGVLGITGYNHDDDTPEGSGKSAIPNALCWLLFGKLPKDAAVDEVIREGEKSCRGELTLPNMTIFRSRAPNDLSFSMKNGPLIRGKGLKETQKLIEKEINISFETFCQTIYFSQGGGPRFVSASQEERGSVLSEILKLEDFDRAQEAVKLKIKDLELETRIKQEAYFGLERTLKEVKSAKTRAEDRLIEEKTRNERKCEELRGALEEISRQKAELFAKVEEKNNKLLELNQDFSALQEDYEGLIKETTILETDNRACEKAWEEFARAGKRITQLTSVLDKKLQELLGIDNKISEIESFDHTKGVCPTCGNIDKTKSSELLNLKTSQILSLQATKICCIEDLTRVESELATLKEVPEPNSREELAGKLHQFSQAAASCKRAIVRNRELAKLEEGLEGKIEAIEFRESEVYRQLEALYAEDFSAAKKELRHNEERELSVSAELEGIKAYTTTIGGRLSDLEALKASFKEAKVFVFSGLLSELNYKVNEYAKKLFSQHISVAFFNEDLKIRLEVFLNGTKRPFGLLSGGQQRRVSLAVDLALNDIILSRTGCPLAVLIWDEALKDLSEGSMEKVLRVLEERQGDVVVIEHSSIFNSIMSNVLHVELRGGVSSYAA